MKKKYTAYTIKTLCLSLFQCDYCSDIYAAEYRSRNHCCPHCGAVDSVSEIGSRDNVEFVIDKPG